MISTLLDSAQWYRALTLKERMPMLQPSDLHQPNKLTEDIRRVAAQWSEQVPFNHSKWLDYRLALDGLSRETWVQLLSIRSETFQARIDPTPIWLDTLNGVMLAPSRSDALPLPAALVGANGSFLNLVDPLLHETIDHVSEAVETLANLPDCPFTTRTIMELICATLPDVVMPAIAPTLVLELNVSRLRGQLEGATPQERFNAFVLRLRDRTYAMELLSEYCVLARHIVEQLNQWETFITEFLERLCDDWATLKQLYRGDGEPGTLESINTRVGDRHGGGRCVIIATFTSGFKLVYKPRPLAVEQHWQDLLVWLNNRGWEPAFRTLEVVDRGGYGWVEYIDADTCVSEAEIHDYYVRQGGYLALLYLLEATDFHRENIIAAGPHPMLVDIEALFQPRKSPDHRRGARYLAQRGLHSSVIRTGLLPQRFFGTDGADGVDLSGIGSTSDQLLPFKVPAWRDFGTDQMSRTDGTATVGQSSNRPTLKGQELDTMAYTDDIVTGFTRLYHLISQHRESLLASEGPLASFEHDTVRALLRPTHLYSVFLHSSYHPDYLRDALDRDQLFDRLWGSAEQQPYLARVIDAEQRDLKQGDIPIFTTQPASHDIWTSNGIKIEGFYEESGLDAARRKIEGLSEADRAYQMWLIRASLTTLSKSADVAPLAPAAIIDKEIPVTKASLVATARSLGDQLVSLAYCSEDEATWLGLYLTPSSEIGLSVLREDLYSGSLGVALFLGYLGWVTDEQRYTEVAKAAVTCALRGIDEKPSDTFPIGGFTGWGGIIYALSHLGALWQDHTLYERALDYVHLMEPLIEADKQLDLIGGAAGCILGLLSLHHVHPSASIITASLKCSDQLRRTAQITPRGTAWYTPIGKDQLLAGMSHGAAGIAMALMELSAVTASADCRRLALDAINFERNLFSEAEGNWLDLRPSDGLTEEQIRERSAFMTAWCNGAPGIGLARLKSSAHSNAPAMVRDIEAAVQCTLASGFGVNHSLCHGELGNLDLLIQVTERLGEQKWKMDQARLTARVLSSIATSGPKCGSPGGPMTPGLMMGLAGIGYGLLRLAHPAVLPSVLTMDPPNTDHV